MEEKKKFTKLEKQWIMYDVGNSAFTLLCSVFIPIMVEALCTAEGMTSTEYQTFWSVVTSVITLLVAVISPIVGTFADGEGMKKPMFFAAALTGIVGCVLLGMPLPLAAFVAVFVIARMAYNISLVFYDSMLTDVTDMERVDKISAHGYAWGYIGSCIPFIISIGLYLLSQFELMSETIVYILVFIINAAWWLCFTIPLTKNFKQVNFVKREKHAVRDSFKRLFGVFKEKIPNKKGILIFLLAFFLYIDGVYTIIDLATTYGLALGIDQIQLVLALLLTQIIAFPCAILSGILAKKYDNGRLIIIFITGYLGIAIFAIFLTQAWQFWFLAVCVGLLQGGVQALSRSYFAKIIPLEKSGEFFGIMDIFGKGASFVGTMLVAIVTAASGNANFGVIPISCLIGVGLVVFIIGYLEINKYEKTHGKIALAAGEEIEAPVDGAEIAREAAYTDSAKTTEEVVSDGEEVPADSAEVVEDVVPDNNEAIEDAAPDGGADDKR